MSMLSKSNIGIVGLGHCLPQQSVPNTHFTDRGMDTNPEWIESRSGIKSRYVVHENQTTSDLAVSAAEHALKNADLDGNMIDFIIVATASPDHDGFPATACLVQKKLNLTRTIPCFDITAACSGFTYGLSIAYSYIQSGIGSYGLVIGAECLSRLVNWNDRRSAILFGDGAGAAVVSHVNSGGFIGFDQGADGHASDILKCTPIENIERFNQTIQPGFSPCIDMDGRAVFKKGIDVVLNSIRAVLSTTNTKLTDIDYFICHQANARILENIAKQLDISIEKFLTNIDHVGNTSAASIPIVLSEFSMQRQFKPGDTLCLVGFGAGFTWSSIIIEWSNHHE